MIKDLYTAALGMIPQQTRLEAIANNIANAETVGYKKESVFEHKLIDAVQSLNNVPGDPEARDVNMGSYTDFKPGAFRQTDNPLDLAIEDDGFFNLQDEQGNIFYSRSGHFSISQDGRIVARDGKMLLGENGPLNIGQENMNDPMITGDKKFFNLKITTNGEVFANDYLIGAVAVTKIDNPETLKRSSGQSFSATEETNGNNIDLAEVRIRQGWIEESNVDIIHEMVDMIELQRQFETGSKVIQTSDRTIEEAIRIGRFF